MKALFNGAASCTMFELAKHVSAHVVKSDKKLYEPLQSTDN